MAPYASNMPAHPILFRSAALAGFLSVAFGAFGAHGLEEVLSPEGQDWWETATQYALIHAVAAIFAAHICHSARAAAAFLIGILLFSGTLYAMALGAPRALGMVTPVGGVCLLLGWAFLGFSLNKRTLSGE